MAALHFLDSLTEDGIELMRLSYKNFDALERFHEMCRERNLDPQEVYDLAYRLDLPGARN